MGLYKDTGKENANYCIMLDYIGIMEKENGTPLIHFFEP